MERRESRRFVIANSLSLVMCFIIIAQSIYMMLQRSRSFSSRIMAIITLCLLVLQCAVSGATLLIAGNAPRRPGLVFGYLAVDGQHTVPMIQRLGFAWVSPILKDARYTTTSLNLPNLPVLHTAMRAESLRHRFMLLDSQTVLWRRILACHKREIFQHYILAIVHSGSQLGSQWVMYQLLRNLEQRSFNNSTDDRIWLWVSLMGLSVFLAAWLETQLLWIVNTKLVISLRAELMMQIYTKILKRRNTNHATNSADKSPEEGIKMDQSSGSKDDKSRENTKSTKLSEGSSQDVINLVALDTKRISDFLGSSYTIPASISKLAISLAFLIHLIGWKSLLLGLSALALLYPINAYCARLMSVAQASIMRVRDSKMSIINEALHSIRQIKFSATEGQYLAKIGSKRHEELSLQWYCFILRTALVGFWQIGPILLSAISLATYATLNGSLSASVAFTTIAIFAQIEGSLAILPGLIVRIQQANISTQRIEQFLSTADQDLYRDDSDEMCDVTLDSATFTWPVDSIEGDSEFFLNNISVSFPSGQLSVITADTGSGKSLLLNALVGEAHKISGSITLPTSGMELDGNDWTSKIWPSSSNIAFVSESAWIENATIRENVLFGLPYSHDRYHQTLFACALTQDLAAMTDGDATEVGVGGINLSGGQKWRLSLARALYSPARILVIDDIFSAVDAHVGLHMYNEALVGPLSQNRTCILATHHIDLCLTKAQYFVRLHRGRLVEARSITSSKTEAGENGQSQRMSSQGEYDPSPAISVEARASSSEHSTVGSLSTATNTPVPKKFVQVEHRQIGAVRFHTYRYYISAIGGLVMLAMIICAHLGYSASILGRVSLLLLSRLCADRFVVMVPHPVDTRIRESTEVHSRVRKPRWICVWRTPALFISMAIPGSFLCRLLHEHIQVLFGVARVNQGVAHHVRQVCLDYIPCSDELV